MSSTNKSLNWIPNCIQTTRICRECGLRFRIHRNSKIDTNIASSGFEFLFISLSPFFFPFRVSQIDNEFLEFYGSLQLCHESKKRQYFDEWKSIDESPPSQSSLGIEPVIPQVDKEEVSSLSLISPFLSLVTVENVKQWEIDIYENEKLFHAFFYCPSFYDLRRVILTLQSTWNEITT